MPGVAELYAWAPLWSHLSLLWVNVIFQFQLRQSLIPRRDPRRDRQLNLDCGLYPE
jgi:hypothetical protein